MKSEAIIVASVSIIDNGKVLLIKEKTSSGIEKWNFPSGRMEYGEDISLVAYREVQEEVGLNVCLIGTTGSYQFISATNDQVILFHFIGEIINGDIVLEEGITDYAWIKLGDLSVWGKDELREPEVIKKILNNLMDENIYPVCIFQSCM